jgi:hypothetical protein
LVLALGEQNFEKKKFGLRNEYIIWE